jgi:HEAT repeat protein
MVPKRRRTALALLLLLLLPGGSARPEGDPAKNPAKERVEALNRLAADGGPGAEDALLAALEERDGEVLEAALAGLAKHATEKSLRPLAEFSIEPRPRRLRIAAAAALGARQAEPAAKLLVSALGAKSDVTAAAAAEALAEIRHPSAKDHLKAAMQAKSAYLRREAAQALGSFREEALLQDLEPFLKDPDPRTRAGAVEGAARIGSVRAIPLLLSEIQDPKLTDLIERRIAAAIRRILWAKRTTEEAEAGQRKVIDAFRNEKSGIVAARIARILGSLARWGPPGAGGEGGRAVPTPADGAPAPEPPPAPEGPAAGPAPPAPVRAGPILLEGEGPVADPAPVVIALGEVGIRHKEAVCRRASAAALGRIGGEEALALLLPLVSADTDELVRFHALRAYRKWRTAKVEAAFQLFHNVLTYDKSPLVREEAAVALGVRGLEGAVDMLAKAAKDPSWEVAVASAVSLGKTRDARAVPALAALIPSKDWRIRGAAAAGLGWTRRVEAIPHLLPLLSDPDLSVARTAWEFLKRLADRNAPLKAKEWEAWWTEKGKGFSIEDREAALRDAKKYGYALADKDVYEDLDVVVLKSRGDTIQNLLSVLDVKHRLTQSANVRKDGVQPFGVFVSNCTGEIQPDDHERVAWFVHAGGALFGSCWAIDKTIGQEFPSTIRKFPGAAGQVLDQVRAEELPTESEYLAGVFPGVVRPIYELYGAFLIEVLDPERVEVLTDSPDCASRWGGGGNLSAWFTAGHGVVMGASNHFDRQTMTKLQGAWGVSVRTEAERRNFAADHFGFSWERIRELDARGVFAKQAEAEKEVTDLSAFRFLTNFVRRKRIGDL